MPSLSDRTVAFILCSTSTGHATISTPDATLSSAELPPHSDTKTAAAGWKSTRDCGTHTATVRPRSLDLGAATDDDEDLE
jgi:hypothetical protein